MNRLLRWALFGNKNHPSIPIINCIKLQGIIAPMPGARGPQARRVISLDKVEQWLLAAFMPPFKSLRPAAVAITLNSPGGSAAQAELIHERIRFFAKETKTPVYTFAEDVAASGAYWLMCAGDELYASKTGLVGSIGVINAGFGLVDLAKKLGLERRVYTAGELKDTLDPFRPVRKEEEQVVRDLVSNLHESFKETVRSARGAKLSAANEAELWSGRVWTGAQAAKKGLVDGTGTLNSVMRAKFGDQALFLQFGNPARPGFLDSLGMRSSLIWQRLTAAPFDVYSVTQSATQAHPAFALTDTAKSMLQAVLDEVDYRIMMSRYGL